MGSPETVRVTGPGSLRGTIDTATWPLDRSRAKVLVQFEGGASMLVPLEALTREDDGSYRLTLDALAVERHGEAGETSEAPLVLPVVEETLAVHTSAVETGRVRISKRVHEREEIIDPPTSARRCGH
jgi:stress response protein YsnF